MFVKKSTYLVAQGFTLVELIALILIIGIVSVIALPKWTGTPINVNYEAARVLNDIRFAQGMSMTTGQRYRWVETSSTTYQVLNEAGTAVILPNGKTTMTLTSGVTFGALTALPSSLIAFGSDGIPYTDTAIPGTALASSATIPLTGSGQTRTVTISAGTGFGALT